MTPQSPPERKRFLQSWGRGGTDHSELPPSTLALTLLLALGHGEGAPGLTAVSIPIAPQLLLTVTLRSRARLTPIFQLPLHPVHGFPRGR